MSRDLIADCIETMHEGYAADGIITFPAATRASRGAHAHPAEQWHRVTLYGGDDPAGAVQGGRPTIVSAFEAIGPTRRER